MSGSKDRTAGRALIAALAAFLLAPAAAAAPAVASFKMGPIVNLGPVVPTAGLEIELSVAPQVALAVSVGSTLPDKHGRRLEVVVGGLRYFFRPEGNRWSLTLYGGGARTVSPAEPPEGFGPLVGAAGGYAWSVGARGQVSVEFGMAVGVAAISAPPLAIVVPVPAPILGAGVGYRF